MKTRRAARPSPEDAEALAVAALSFLALEPERLGAFLGETGLDPDNLRAAARDPGFMAAILDYLIGNEAVLIDFAVDQSIDPAAVVAARRALPDAHHDL